MSVSRYNCLRLSWLELMMTLNKEWPVTLWAPWELLLPSRIIFQCNAYSCAFKMWPVPVKHSQCCHSNLRDFHYLLSVEQLQGLSGDDIITGVCLLFSLNVCSPLGGLNPRLPISYRPRRVNQSASLLRQGSRWQMTNSYNITVRLG